MTRDGHTNHGTCSECGAPLQLGERRMCQACWNAYWDAQLEAVPVERLATAEQAHLEQVGNELVLITINLRQRLVLAERTIEERDRTIEERDQIIRYMQERIDNLHEDLRISAEYLAVASDQVEKEQARVDGLLRQNNKLAAELMETRQQHEKRNGHRLTSR